MVSLRRLPVLLVAFGLTVAPAMSAQADPPPDSGAAVVVGSGDYTQADVPPLPESATYTDVAHGSHHAFLLRSDGQAVAFGDNTWGQSDVPDLPTGTTYTGAAAGYTHSVLLRSDGHAVPFGGTTWGQTDLPGPPAGATYTDVAAGFGHTVLIRSDGQGIAIGRDDYGQTDVPALPAGLIYTDVAAGSQHTILLRSDGQAIAFGQNDQGQTDVPALPPGVTYTDAAGGSKHTILLRSDGQVIALGRDTEGQTDVPPLPAGLIYTDVAAGFWHTIVMRSDGQTLAFGNDDNGQTDVPSPPAGTTYTSIGAGNLHTVLLRSAAATEVSLDPPDATVAGEDVDLNATVESDVDLPFTGTVRFTIDGETVDVPVGANGSATTTLEAPTVPGDLPISATYLGSTDGSFLPSPAPASANLDVTPGAVTSLELAPADSEFPAGTVLDYAVTGEDEYGNDVGDLIGDVTLSTPDAEINDFTVTFTQAGEHIVTAVLDDDPEITATATVDVTAGPLADIELTTDQNAVGEGDTVTLSVAGEDAYGNPVPVESEDVQLSTNRAGDIVDGLTIILTDPGTATITAAIDGLADSVDIDVTPAPRGALPDAGTALTTTGLLAALGFLTLGASMLRRTRHTHC